MNPQDIAVLGGVDPIATDYLAEILEHAAIALRAGRDVRFTVDGGLKIAVGGGCWTSSLGRIADETGR